MTAQRPCTCPHDERPLGILDRINMGRGPVRLMTNPGCPEHDTCHRYTAAYRREQPEWSNPYCPIHATKNCPDTVQSDRPSSDGAV